MTTITTKVFWEAKEGAERKVLHRSHRPEDIQYTWRVYKNDVCVVEGTAGTLAEANLEAQMFSEQLEESIAKGTN